MKLHENKELFKDAVIATAQKQGIKEIFVEKDYWVTLILKAVFKIWFTENYQQKIKF